MLGEEGGREGEKGALVEVGGQYGHRSVRLR